MFDSEIATRRPPRNLVYEDIGLFESEFRKQLPAVRLEKPCRAFLFPSCHLFKGLLWDARQSNMGISPKRILLIYAKSLFSLLRLRRVQKIDKGYFFTSLASTNFFHWFLDSLQKLESVSGEKSTEVKDHVFIVPSDHHHDFIINSLSAFNFKFIFQKKHQLLVINRLIVLPDIAPTGNYKKEMVNKFRDRVFCHLSHDAKERTANRRIYITRKNAKRRKIINEMDLIPILRAAGFEIADMDNLGFKEQVELINGAKILVSLHGAGLAHMLWMKKGGFVFEIRARGDCHNNCFFSLASDLSLDYYYALADKVDPALSTQLSDFKIDPIYFENQLMNMLANSEHKNY